MSTTRTEDAMRWGRPSLVEQLRAERDHARALCVTYEQMLNMTPEERDLFTKPRWMPSDVPASRCPVCSGTTEHVLGCPEMDKPR